MSDENVESARPTDCYRVARPHRVPRGGAGLGIAVGPPVCRVLASCCRSLLPALPTCCELLWQITSSFTRLQARVSALVKEQPGVGVKALVRQISAEHPEWAAGAKEVRQAIQLIDAAAEAEIEADVRPLAALTPPSPDAQRVKAKGAVQAEPGRCQQRLEELLLDGKKARGGSGKKKDSSRPKGKMALSRTSHAWLNSINRAVYQQLPEMDDVTQMLFDGTVINPIQIIMRSRPDPIENTALEKLGGVDPVALLGVTSHRKVTSLTD